MVNNKPILTGYKEIAAFCGVTTGRIEKWIKETDFPVSQEGKNGGYITTAHAVTNWLTERVSKPKNPKVPRQMSRA